MPRKAGSDPYYTFVLLDKLTGLPDKRHEIRLPSVTSVIKAVLAAPALVGWAYRFTRDNIASMLGTINPLEEDGEGYTLFDLVSDADVLEEWLKENRMRPDDYRDEKGDEGEIRHEFLEALAKAPMVVEPDGTPHRLRPEPKDAHEEAILKWWDATVDEVIESEALLMSLRHCFAGTVDLIYTRKDRPGLGITDLKNRKAGADAYDSDHAQTGGYKIAWEEQHPDQPISWLSVLIARADGTFVERETDAPVERIFLHIRELYDMTRGLR